MMAADVLRLQRNLFIYIFIFIYIYIYIYIYISPPRDILAISHGYHPCGSFQTNKLVLHTKHRGMEDML